MNRHIEAFSNGYAKAFNLFPSSNEDIYTDWNNIGKDIDIAFKIYKKELSRKLWKIEKKKKKIQ